jgi:hypothetical protein
MSGYLISPGDRRRFKASFRDTECQVCFAPIYRGDPVGFLNYRSRLNKFGPLCIACLDVEGVRFSVQTLDEIT